MRLRFIILVLLALLITAGFVGAVSAENIGSVTVSGISVPALGKEQVSSAKTDIKNVTADVEWNYYNGVFKAGIPYEATVTLRITGNYENFTASTSASITNISGTQKKYVDNKTIEITFSSELVAQTIEEVNIDLAVPVAGNISSDPTTKTIGIDDVTVIWDPLLSSNKFAPNQTYTATIKITSLSDYEFSSDPKPTVKINNNEINSNSVIRKTGLLTVTQKFNPTDYITIPRVNLSLTAPVAGASPSTSATAPDTDGIDTLAVTWSPVATTFAVNTSYNASINIKTKNGYKLDGAKIYLGTDEITNIYKKSSTEWIVNKTFANTSSNIEISTVTISGLTTPQSGATPVTASSLTSTTGTTVKSIVWSPSATTFAGNTEYTATVIVETTSPYKYASTKPIVKIGSTTVTESAVTRNSDTNISFTYKFGKTTNLIYPSIIFTATPVTGNIPLDVVFTYNITNSTSQSITYGEVTSTETLSKTNDTLKHTYSKAGTYTAKITATNANGTTTKEITIKPTEEGLTASFIYTPTYGNAPLTVSFTDKSIGNIKTRQWNFNGLGTSTEKNPQFTFTSAGSHKVTLTITDIYGKTATWYEIIAVSPPLSSQLKTTEDTSSLETQKDNNNSSVFVPNPIGIIQELVKLFMALFNFDNYIMFQNNTTVTSP